MLRPFACVHKDAPFAYAFRNTVIFNMAYIPDESEEDRLARRSKNEIIIFGSEGFRTLKNDDTYRSVYKLLKDNGYSINTHRYDRSEFSLIIYDYVLEKLATHKGIEDESREDKIFLFLYHYDRVYKREMYRMKVMQDCRRKLMNKEEIDKRLRSLCKLSLRNTYDF